MNKQKMLITVSLTLLGAVEAALAHVTLESPKSIAGEGYKAVLRVGHGCAGGSATTALSVLIPEGVMNAKPMPKAGWAIVVKKMQLAEPLNVHGHTASEAVQEITWTATTKEAALGDDQYDEFIVRGTLPVKAGVLWWKTVQSCANGKNEWVEVPDQGTSIKGLKRPAAPLEVTPAPQAITQSPAVHAH